MSALARLVGKYFWRNRALRKNIAPISVRTLVVEPTPVYNITLAQDNAYYANDILVFNCADALVMGRYPARATAGHLPSLGGALGPKVFVG